MLINRIKGQNLSLFVKEWDAFDYKKNKVNYLKKSKIGNINNLGKPSCSEAQLFTKNDSCFVDSIEPKVKELVLVIINNLNYITFSSCEGHPEYFDKDEQILVNFRERQVSILPRNENEHQKILKTFNEIVKTTNNMFINDHIYINLTEEILEEITDDYRKEWISISIIFTSKSDDFKKYFGELEKIYKIFLKNFKLVS